jgi:hypothetical protein
VPNQRGVSPHGLYIYIRDVYSTVHGAIKVFVMSFSCGQR